MLQRANPWQAYRKVATQTATPGQLILQLYDGILRFLEQARLGFALDDPKEFNEAINNNIQRAHAIIRELDSALNLEQGGEVAVTLRRLYGYFDDRLQQANLTKTEEGITEVIRHATGLRDAWRDMLAGQSPDATALNALRTA